MIDPEELLTVAEEIGRAREQYLKWKTIVDRYKRGEKSKYAECYLAADGDAVRDREMIAYSSSEFKEYLSEWENASKHMILGQIKCENLETKFDAIQSTMAYLRDTTKRLG